MSEEKIKKEKFPLSHLLSGIGIGLMLGFIMGLSVSPVVKTIMGSLSALLAALLGYGDQLFKNQNNPEKSISHNNWKTAGLGFALAAGILIGIAIRTNNTFAPSVKDSVNKWVEAGYDSTTAKKYVAFERLGINPTSGDVMETTGEMQKSGMSSLFSDKTAKELSADLDPDKWGNNIDLAIDEAILHERPQLEALLVFVKKNLPDEKQFEFLKQFQQVLFTIEDGDESNDYCDLPEDNFEWSGKELVSLSNSMIDLSYDQRLELSGKLKDFFCSLKN